LSVIGAPDRSTPTFYGESLTERELEVLGLIAQGATNLEIAQRLVITVGTVKSHVNHILGKLNSQNRTEAVARARALGWLDR
jgi:LuxR family maltose regulon positive regulatory protein